MVVAVTGDELISNKDRFNLANEDRNCFEMFGTFISNLLNIVIGYLRYQSIAIMSSTETRFLTY